MMTDWAPDLPDVKPTAVIFHISRCGSTLISQMLSCAEQNTVLAEVPIFDHILRLPFCEPSYQLSQVNLMLVAALKYYGRINDDGASRVFIKTDSWHIFFYDQLRALLPDTPFILLYRRPDEVARSHRKVPGMHVVPGLIEPELFGIKIKEPWRIRPDVYLAKVLESYLAKYLEIAENDRNAMLVNYSEGPVTILQKVAAFSNFVFGEDELEKMAERSRYHSKRPDEPFGEESGSDIPASLEHAMKLYHKLDEKRITGSR